MFKNYKVGFQFEKKNQILCQLECLKLKIQFQMHFNDYYFHHWTRHARHHAIAYFQLQIYSALWPELLIFVQKL